MPLDGTFRDNVFVQVKNGPLDFQPREPFHPLFGAMPKTPLMAELQITQEYLGQSTHLVYLAPMWNEFLESDTYSEGPWLARRRGSSTARWKATPAPASPASPTPAATGTGPATTSPRRTGTPSGGSRGIPT